MEQDSCLPTALLRRYAPLNDNKITFVIPNGKAGGILPNKANPVQRGVRPDPLRPKHRRFHQAHLRQQPRPTCKESG